MTRVSLRHLVYALILLAACNSQPGVNGGERLLNSESDYLRDHADNPVEWYEWGDEAFQRAKDENKPVIISIGYAACYWCHEMERECFMDSAIARVMNDEFISIKVDREQRPDIDQLFLHAAEVLNANAGWPLNAFATPEGKPFSSVTYQTRQEWLSLLKGVSVAWKKDSEKLTTQARDIEHNIALKEEYPFVTDTVLRHDLSAFMNNVNYWEPSLDLVNGGIKERQKFYRPPLINFMIQHTNITNAPSYEKWIGTTLNAIADGVVYDTVNGGFFRYSTNDDWSAAHYEKMLYDNAQMVSVYSKAFAKTKNPRYRALVNATLQFIEKEMTSPEGGFYSSIDAQTDEDRQNKVHPKTYKQIITSWNAMMLTGYVDAYKAFGDSHYLDIAIQSATFLKNEVTRNGDVFRHASKNVSKPDGFLDDYAWMANAMIAVYQVTYDIQWLETARQIAEVAVSKFDNREDDLFYYSSKSDLQKNTELFDTMMPSSNSVLAEVLLVLGEYYQNEAYTEIATKAITKAISPFSIEGIYLGNWARIAEAMRFHPYEIAIVGPDAIAFTRELQKHPLPPSIFLGGDSENLPLLQDKKVEGRTMIYVCKNRTCKFPVSTPVEALKLIVK